MERKHRLVSHFRAPSVHLAGRGPIVRNREVKKTLAHKPAASFAHEGRERVAKDPELFYRGLGFSEQEPTKAPVEYVVLA